MPIPAFGFGCGLACTFGLNLSQHQNYLENKGKDYMKLFNKVKSMPISYLIKDNNRLRSRNRELVRLCHEKDSYFTEMISDGLRHGSKLAGKHMADLKKYKAGKY